MESDDITMPTYHFDFDQIRETAFVSFRRAQVFVGLCHQAALNSEVNSWAVEDADNIRFVPTGPAPEEMQDWLSSNEVSEEELRARKAQHAEDPQRLRDYKREWLHWAIHNAFTETIESFELFLTQIFHALRCFSSSDEGKLSPTLVPTLREEARKFAKFGLRRQLHELEKQCGMSFPNDDRESLNSLSIARNCITHAKGVVRATDCDPSGYLKVAWRPSVHVLGYPDGSFKEAAVGDYVAEGQMLGMRTITRQRLYKAGVPIWLSSQDLLEVCYFLYRCVAIVMKHVNEEAGTAGISESGRGNE